MILRTIPTVVLVLGLAAHPAGTPIGFAPAEGREVRKHFEVELLLALEDLSMMMNGQDMSGMADTDLDLEVEVLYELETAEIFEGVSEGFAREIRRSYETVGFSMEGVGESEEESLDELEGNTVLFTWNEEEQGYDRAWAEGVDEEEDGLSVLAADLDMRALLPPDDVEEGDTWTVPASELSTVFLPGFDFANADTSEIEGFEDVPLQVLEPLREALEETVLTCTYAGLRRGEKGDLALIELELSTEIALDLAEALAEAARQQSDGEAEISIDSFEVDAFLDFEGELTWDLEAGHFDSLDLFGGIAIDVYGDAEMEMEQMKLPMEYEAEITGELSIEGSVE